MVSACWCGLLAALSLLLDARYIHFPSVFSPTLTLLSALFSDSGDLSLNCSPSLTTAATHCINCWWVCGGGVYGCRGTEEQFSGRLLSLNCSTDRKAQEILPTQSHQALKHLVVNTFMFFACFILQFCILLFKPLHHWHRPFFFSFFFFTPQILIVIILSLLYFNNSVTLWTFYELTAGD